MKQPLKDEDAKTGRNKDMKDITVMTGRDGLRAFVRETEEPGTWELRWTGSPEPPVPYRTLRNAENAVLRNGGERLAVTCPPGPGNLRERLDKYPKPEVTRAGDRYLMELIVTADDGLIHDDDDFRTPLARITCSTCVYRIAERRVKRREEAFGKGSDEAARHSRLAAEAYTRLAEIEENLNIPGPG